MNALCSRLLRSGMVAILVLGVLPATGAEPAATPAPAPAPAPEVVFRKDLVLTETDRTIVQAFVGHAVASAKKLTAEKVAAKCLKAPEMFAWVDFPALNCLNISYELTGDTQHLDQFRDSFELYRSILKKGPDDYLGWYGSPIEARIPKDNPGIQIDEIQMNFRAVSILSKWIDLARSNPEYAKANEAVIKTYLTLMEDHLVPKWDKRGFYVDLEGIGGVYRGLDYPIEGGVTLSHEKLSIMLDALLRLHRVTGKDVYLKRAVALGARFKSCLMLVDGHYEWMSWHPAGPWDVAKDKENAWKTSWIAPDPNAEWYVTALSIALKLYQHGLVFTDEDLARFVKTQKEMCWNGDLAAPAYRNVAGETSKWIKGRFLSMQLAHYDETLRKLAFYGPHEAEILANAASDWKGGINAQNYVVEKFLMQPVVKGNPRPDAQVGERFLANPENQEFYRKLVRSVVAPGATRPTTPQAMGF